MVPKNKKGNSLRTKIIIIILFPLVFFLFFSLQAWNSSATTKEQSVQLVFTPPHTHKEFGFLHIIHFLDFSELKLPGV